MFVGYSGAAEYMADSCRVEAGGRFRSHTPDGKTTEDELKTGEVIYREPLTHWSENIGDKPAHMILVELKNAAGGGASPHP